jgi:metallophosphoesterase (TIGR00282 family)
VPRILFLGDIVGRPGREIVAEALPRLRSRWEIDLIVANAENVAGGSGITIETHGELRSAGVDAMTLGDHAYKQDEVHLLFERHAPLCRAANYPTDAPGPDHLLVQAHDGTPVALFLIQGRAFMPPVDCPLRAADRVLESLPTSVRVILVDIHAESTAEKQTIARYLDGRVTAVLGTHTHVPTADEQILINGTAYQTDLGMTGPYDSVIGRRYDRVLAATLSPVPQRFEVASGEPRLCGALLDADATTGRARSIRRVCLHAGQARQLRGSSMYDPLEDEAR